ncbi:protein kinase [Nocardiopsis sp. CNT312]|uniref:serine/threonine protein kinase n=1 Tax=Nocardiopsis sp. CNT312 TaxID=1137268 RepID=UPI000490CC92|nr:protein kinase [Nocardiopsis sp. CNT312]
MSGSEHTAWAPGYESLTVLREGPRARIVRGRRTTSGADVVLKVLSRSAGQAELDRLRELSGSPGVVPLLDAGSTADGDFFVALPFYADGSFADMLARRGPTALQESAAIARSTAAALGAVHARGLVHDAVSPGNVLRAGRTSVLTGFGSVCPIGAAAPPPGPESDGFWHAPPEALRGEARSAASDVYRLASTLWTLLMGRSPFAPEDGSAPHSRDHARRVLTEEAPPVTRGDVSRVLRGVLARALAKAPEERYDSAAAFAAAFERARAPQAAPGTGPQAPYPGTGPQRPPHVDPASSPIGGPHPYTGPQASPATPYTVSTGAPPYPAGGQGAVPAPPYAIPSPPVPPPPGAPPGSPRSGPQAPPVPASRPDSTGHLHSEPPPSENPAPLEGELDPNSTADLMMAKLRGEKIPPRIAWSRVEGWSGTAESSRLPYDSPAPDGEEYPSFGRPAPRQARWRGHLHIAAAVAGILVVTAAAAGFAAVDGPAPVLAAPGEDGQEADTVTGGPSEEAGASGGPSTAPSAPASGEGSGEPLDVVDPAVPAPVGAPTGILLADGLDTVRLTWSDNSGGTASFFVVGGRLGHDPATLARIGAGVTSAQIATANTVAEYCFTVVAVDGAAGPSEEVCTTRAANREAEEEAREEAEASASPSDAPSDEPSDG